MTAILHLSHYKFDGTRFIMSRSTFRNLIQYILLVVLLILTISFPDNLGSTMAHAEGLAIEVLDPNIVLPEDVLTTEAASYIQRVNSALTETDASNFANHVVYSAQAFKLDVAVLLALITVESGFKPEAVSKFGALGLMQVIPRWHLERISKSRKVTNTYSLYEPKLNIYVGAWALRDCIGESKSLDNALLRYNGSLSDPQKSYARTVLAEAARVRDKFLNRQAKL